jgi:hypothetical protein
MKENFSSHKNEPRGKRFFDMELRVGQWYCMEEISETNVVSIAGLMPGTEEYNNLTKLEILAELKAFTQT